jgi:hypothetical protein
MTACPNPLLPQYAQRPTPRVSTHLFLLFIILIELARYSHAQHFVATQRRINSACDFCSTLLFALQSQALPTSIRHSSEFDVRRPHGNNSSPCRKRVQQYKCSPCNSSSLVLLASPIHFSETCPSHSFEALPNFEIPFSLRQNLLSNS